MLVVGLGVDVSLAGDVSIPDGVSLPNDVSTPGDVSVRDNASLTDAEAPEDNGDDVIDRPDRVDDSETEDSPPLLCVYAELGKPEDSVPVSETLGMGPEELGTLPVTAAVRAEVIIVSCPDIVTVMVKEDTVNPRGTSGGELPEGGMP